MIAGILKSLGGIALVLALLGALLLGNAGAEEVKLKWLPAGAAAKMGGFIPQHIELAVVRPAGLTRPPENLAAPLYGEIKLGPAESPTTFFIIVDEPAGKPSRLWVDANGNGDFSDDPPAEWKPRAAKGPGGVLLTSYFGGAMLKVVYGAETLALHVPMYRLDKNDREHAASANWLFYYGDYGWTGAANIGGRFYSALLSDRMTTGDFRGGGDAKHPPAVLFLDLNGDGRFDLFSESFRTDRPFRIAGLPYEIAGMRAAGGTFQLNKGKLSPAELKAVLGVLKGNRALGFEARALDGNVVKFPDSYRGKLVLLDFWATWCPPCRAELPHLVAAYQKLHSHGFEVLGVTLDDAGDGPMLTSFIQNNHMPWPEIYEGKLWDVSIAKLYQVHSIPHPFLVDGDTGLIVAEGDALRGEDLTEVLEQVLEKRNRR